MRDAIQVGLGRRSLGVSCLSLLPILALGCKCAPTRSSAPAGQTAVSLAAPVASRPEPPIEFELAFVALNRARRFAEARSLLADLPAHKATLPAYRFVNAYLAIRTNDGAQALPLLEGMEVKLPELTPDIEVLRAEARLQTGDALAGAAWLEPHGRRDVWLEAVRTLVRLSQRDAALIAVDKGLLRAAGRSGARFNAVIANLRALRAELYQNSGEPERALDDLRWLALEAPGHLPARILVTRAIDESRLRLEPLQQLGRLRRLADAGWVERVDLESIRLTQQSPRLMSPALSAYLRGRARQVARVDQIEGAKLLEHAADLKIDDATQIRIDAARLYLREGDVQHAVQLYERVAKLDRARRQESQFYAARALATLGEHRHAIDRYSQFVERYPSGRWRKSAQIERALLWLAMGEVKSAEQSLLRLSAEAANSQQKPMLLELSGLGAFLLGQKAEAIARWQTVASESPLSLAGAFAVVRLRQLSAPIPSQPAAPAPLARNEPASLSRRTDQLLAFGLEDLAAHAQRSEQAAASDHSNRGNTQNVCRAWGKIGYGERGFIASRSIRDGVDLSEALTDEARWRWDCRFPRPYAAMVQEFETEYHLPEYLLFAVMRQESGFDPAIVSPAGAVGLLQLLPATASRVAEEIHMPDEILLEEPRTNLRLGAAYLRKLLDVFDQNLGLAIAAYNAGPQAVALWLKHARSSSVELFAARIPYAETQKYVERVLGNLLVYRYLNGSDRDFAGLSLELPKELKDSQLLY